MRSLPLRGVAACKLGLNLFQQELMSVCFLFILLVATWNLLFACLLTIVSFWLRLDDLPACAEVSDSAGPGVTEGFVMIVNSENCDRSVWRLLENLCYCSDVRWKMFPVVYA